MSEQMQPQDRWIEIDGLRLHYLEWGNADAQPMMLLHGLQDCARSWDFFAASLSSDYHVIALDHRGHGDSGRASSDRYGLQDYVSDIEALVERLELRKIVLIGHSAGGRNAFVYAANHPELVESLVIVDIDPDAANLDSQEMFNRYMSESDEWDSLEAVVERLRSRQPNSTDEMLIHQATYMTSDLPGGRRAWKRDRTLLAAYERPDLWAEWSQISQPTLIIRGRQSNLLTHEVAVKMREAIPRARLAELEGGGHWFYQEIPDEFETAVRWFLENLP
ncbi:MAG: alpha/beta hydrolase [Chloroflexi bacterium]|nr:alpha/beta hydrolase [Chloroflexota bacterium]